MMRYWDAPVMRGYGYGVGAEQFIFHIISWVIIAFIIAMIVRALFGHGKRWGDFGDGGSDRGLNILKERYAKGELTKKEFEEMKKDIS